MPGAACPAPGMADGRSADQVGKGQNDAGPERQAQGQDQQMWLGIVAPRVDDWFPSRCRPGRIAIDGRSTIFPLVHVLAHRCCRTVCFVLDRDKTVTRRGEPMQA